MLSVREGVSKEVSGLGDVETDQRYLYTRVHLPPLPAWHSHIRGSFHKYHAMHLNCSSTANLFDLLGRVANLTKHLLSVLAKVRRWAVHLALLAVVHDWRGGNLDLASSGVLDLLDDLTSLGLWVVKGLGDVVDGCEWQSDVSNKSHSPHTPCLSIAQPIPLSFALSTHQSTWRRYRHG